MKTPCACTNLRQASRKLTAIYDEALSPLGINIAQFHLLRTIRRLESLSLTELGRIAELERSTAGRNVRVLERLGLVKIGRSEVDRRGAWVSLSDEGAAVLVAAEPLWERCQDRFAARLGRDELAALERLLELI
jgi:DNA-binding MarR family transcriptional regulator